MPASTPLAYAADWVFDGQRFLRDHAVIVAGGVVTALCARGQVPGGVPLVYEPGATILPGLIDVHAHYMRWQGPLFLAYGVTAIRDVGNDLAFILAQRASTPNASTPRIVCVGPLLDGPQPTHPLVSRACATRQEGVTAVRETAEAGVDGIKFYHNLDRKWLPRMADEAHRHALKASMHCLQSGVLAAAKAGVDEFFHLDGVLADVWPDHPPGWLSVWGLPGFRATRDAPCRVADRLAALGVTATPTLVYWESQWRLRAPESDLALHHVPAEIVRWQGSLPRDAAVADQWHAALRAAQEFVGLLLERGVRVLPGSDVPCGCVTPGLSLWQEMGLLVAAGMSLEESLRAATAEAAAFLGLPQLGRLAPGASADLVVVRGNLAQGLPAHPELVTVVRDGIAQRPVDLLASAREAAGCVMGDPWAEQLRGHSSG